MKLEYPKEWFERSAEIEGTSEVGAGCPAVASSVLEILRKRMAAKPLEPNQDVVAWKDCPECKGRGWFLINPFATGGANLCGGPRNISQCDTCKAAHDHFKQHGTLPTPAPNASMEAREKQS